MRQHRRTKRYHLSGDSNRSGKRPNRFSLPTQYSASFETDVSPRRPHEKRSTRHCRECRVAQCQTKRQSGYLLPGKYQLQRVYPELFGRKEGDIIELETGKKLGKHKGYWFHTIGQRKGLGLSGGPWFVIRKDIESNTLYVSNGFDPDTQYGTELNLTGFRFITGNPLGDLSEPTPHHVQKPAYPRIYRRHITTYRRRESSYRIGQPHTRYRTGTIRCDIQRRPSALPRQRRYRITRLVHNKKGRIKRPFLLNINYFSGISLSNAVRNFQ